MTSRTERTTKEQLAYVLAVWFGSGLAPVAPGTVGSIAALPLYFAVRAGGPLAVAATAVAVTLIGVWAADVVARVSRQKDPQIIVVDEVAGTLIALAAAPFTIAGVVLAVAAFRLFDITKPGPVKAAERLPGGWGIVMDDVVAGVFAAVLVLAVRLTGVLS